VNHATNRRTADVVTVHWKKFVAMPVIAPAEGRRVKPAAEKIQGPVRRSPTAPRVARLNAGRSATTATAGSLATRLVLSTTIEKRARAPARTLCNPHHLALPFRPDAALCPWTRMVVERSGVYPPVSSPMLVPEGQSALMPRSARQVALHAQTASRAGILAKPALVFLTVRQ